MFLSWLRYLDEKIIYKLKKILFIKKYIINYLFIRRTHIPVLLNTFTFAKGKCDVRTSSAS